MYLTTARCPCRTRHHFRRVIRRPALRSLPLWVFTFLGWPFLCEFSPGRLPIHGFMRVLAGAVAYSRVHSGVHYPADVLVGSVIGIAIGHIAARVGGSRADA